MARRAVMPAAAACVLLAVWTPLWLLAPVEACMETAWEDGYLPLESSLQEVTLASSSGTSCACCALCHQVRSCASISFKAATRQCRLHDSVASYSTLVTGTAWKYLVMPGRSGHHQFCRHDSDCQTEGDSCRGRVCTQLTSVTCRVIYETFGAGGRFGVRPRMRGWLSDDSLLLSCIMKDSWPGFTGLLASLDDTTFTRATIGYSAVPKTRRGFYSLLDLAEEIRRSGSDPTYRLLLAGNNQRLTVQFDAVPRAVSVLTDSPRVSPVGNIVTNKDIPGLKSVAMPYRPAAGKDLLLVGVTTASEGQTVRPLVSTDGTHWNGLLDNLNLHIRE